MIADRLEVFGAQRQRQRLAVRAGEDPVQVGIRRRVERRQRMPRALQDACRHAALDVGEELGIASQPPHHGAREEQLEQPAPAPRVPHLLVEALARLAARRAGQQSRHARARVDERQHPLPERGEVALELAGAADAGVDVGAVCVPERPRVARQLRAAARVERASIADTAASRSAAAARRCVSARYAATRSSRQASCAALRSTATTRAGRPVSSASVLSPAERSTRSVCPGCGASASTRTSASSQHCA